ncbi:14670_t:CDS:2 [Ambispora leptoticha]|uniref:14670_t:CDS:1 n=1 Tax=Ambispora leptoticha TaxID=144679 RepID=A0A9N8Z778_9GLOM|nr:14670_t:CDS:2 [Ambispora leptoticha]
MVETKQRKKFKRKEIEEYLKGIKSDREVRRRLRITSEAQDKRDFVMFSGFRLEPIAGTKNYWSIRTGSGA